MLALPILILIICILQRHKLGSNLTPVTPESFAKWKQTRMNKKQAEEEAVKKAKDTQAAAGKNSGMSGRDLVSGLHKLAVNINSMSSICSSRTIRSGSKMKKTKRMSGTLRNIVSNKKLRTRRQRKRGFETYSWTMVNHLLLPVVVMRATSSSWAMLIVLNNARYLSWVLSHIHSEDVKQI